MIATTTLLLLINTVRTKPLLPDKQLDRIAETRCYTMKEWSHKGFPINQLARAGYFYLGENLAMDFPDPYSMFNALQASPTHKSNNQYPYYQKVGIFNCNNKVGNVTVFLFGGKKT